MTVKSYAIALFWQFFLLPRNGKKSVITLLCGLAHCPAGRQSPLPLVSLGTTVVLQRVPKRNTAQLNEMAVEVRLAIKGHTALQLSKDWMWPQDFLSFFVFRYSALKKDGQRLSVLLKKGHKVEAKPARPVTVYNLSLQGFNPPHFTLGSPHFSLLIWAIHRRIFVWSFFSSFILNQ